jgi:putative ABC transport system substrate-binding protein
MQRREFITLLGGAAAAPAMLWPEAARAQQQLRVRRIGWLASEGADDASSEANLAAFRESLGKLGWVEGRNLKVEFRFAAGDLNRLSRFAAELVSLSPELVIATSAPATRAMQQQTQTIPVVFTAGSDPVGFGFTGSLARPEGNITGFSNLYPSIAGKWLELLKEAAPHVARVAVIFNPETRNGAYFAPIDAGAPVLGMQITHVPVRDSVEIVRAIDAFAAQPSGGLLVLPPPLTSSNRDTVFKLAAQHRLPAMYSGRNHVVAGGLMAYSSDTPERHRRAAPMSIVS